MNKMNKIDPNKGVFGVLHASRTEDDKYDIIVENATGISLR